MAGLNVMIVEDEPLVAMAIELLVQDVGGVAVGPFATVAQAIGAIETGLRIDCALLDYNLGKDQSEPVAEALISRSVPFAFTSGQAAKEIQQRFPGHVVFEKPLDEERLKAFLRQHVRNG
jgi:CheY-like chemotaxis protein